LACHRLARLIGQGPGVVDALVAIAIDGRADAGDRAVLANASLTAGQAAAMREALANLPPMPRMIDKIDVSERFMFLDSLATAARDGFDSMTVSGGQRSSTDTTPRDEHARAALDWDVMSRMGNAWYDRLVAAGRRPDRDQRLAEIAKFEEDLKALSKSNCDAKTVAASFLLDKRSELIGNIYICLMMPAVVVAVQAEDRAAMEAELLQVGFALAAYRADHGSYPQQLGELSPRYLARVPVDVFAGGAALHYRRQDAGYLLYSVGPNGRDDGGHRREEGQKAGQDWDDVSIRVPPASEATQGEQPARSVAGGGIGGKAPPFGTAPPGTRRGN
jgi:hypothetical protein